MSSGYGPQGYPPLSLFKALILQAWHSLSDPGLEEALRVRLDFMTFTGFDMDIPDETTFCRFRVEQCFGTLKRKFYFSRSSYMGLDKTWGQFIAKAIAFNLKKALRQVNYA